MYSKISKVLIFPVLILLLLTGVASAQEWIVTAQGDTDKINNSMTDPDNMTLRQAISKASSGDTITFAENISEINIIYGTLNISKDLTIGGNTKIVVKKDPSPVTQDLTVFTITGSTVQFNQLTIENGYVMNGTGGGVLADKSNVTFDSCTLQRNRADLGGAIYVSNGSNIKLISSVVYKNNATTDGSAIFVQNGTVDIENSIVEGNADKYNVIRLEKGQMTLNQTRLLSNEVTSKGSPINASGGTTVEIKNSTFSNNSGTESGGVLASGTLIVENAVFSDSKSTGSGGSITLKDGGNGTIRYSVFTNNTAGDDGGAIHVDANSGATVSYCTFLNNAAKYGGAFFGRGTFTIDSCTAVNNTAMIFGGAIAVWNDAKATLTKNAIAGNTAKANNTAKDPAGGGLNISRSEALITGNVIVGNTDPRNLDFGEENATVRSGGNNLVGIYRGTGRFPIESTDVDGITPGDVFVIDSNGLPAVTRAVGQTAGYDKVQVYTVELNSSPNNPAASILGENQSTPEPDPESPEEDNQNPTQPPEEGGSSWTEYLMYLGIGVILIVIIAVGAYAYLKYREKNQYKFG